MFDTVSRGPFDSEFAQAGNAVMTESTASPRRLGEWLRLIRSEFHDEPDMRLTLQQAADHWDVDQPVLEIILETFVDVGFLRRSIDGAYSRRWPQA